MCLSKSRDSKSDEGDDGTGVPGGLFDSLLLLLEIELDEGESARTLSFTSGEYIMICFRIKSNDMDQVGNKSNGRIAQSN